MDERVELSSPLVWKELPWATRESMMGKLSGLWGWPTDESAFDSLQVDKQQALLLIMGRLSAKGLWGFVRKITNAYGLHGVGIDFTAWHGLQANLVRRKDFTRLFAKHKTGDGGFYERRRSRAVLHFLYQEGIPRAWHVHFDLYSPVHSLDSAMRHLRHEYLGTVKPDWLLIKQAISRS